MKTGNRKPVPLIDVTDLYHPHQDVGDNFDLVLPYALSEEIDLRAVVLDCTERFRQARTDHPNPHYRDEHGPRDPGFVSVLQLNYIFGRNVPAAVGPFLPLRGPNDPATDAPAFQQEGIELILRTLRDADEPVDIAIFCSCRAVTAAFNRDPELLRRKVRRIHLSAGGHPRGYLEWNVMLDPHAFVGLLRSGLPIDLVPCATDQGPFELGVNNSFWLMPDLRWLEKMEPSLRRYLGFALQRLVRMDFLRAMDEDWPALLAPEAFRTLFGWEHKVWETTLWQNITGRKLVRRADGTSRIVRPEDLRSDDYAVPEEMMPVTLNVSDEGHFDARPTGLPTPFRLYHRPDPLAMQGALREALPALYLSFRTPHSSPNAAG